MRSSAGIETQFIGLASNNFVLFFNFLKYETGIGVSVGVSWT